MKRYCDAKPVATALGFAAACLKSETVVVEPRPKPTIKINTRERAVKMPDEAFAIFRGYRGLSVAKQ